MKLVNFGVNKSRSTMVLCSCNDCEAFFVRRNYKKNKDYCVLCSQRHKTFKVEPHGYSIKKDRIYAVWQNMKRRCLDETNHHYYAYGARGVKVCDDWLEFRPFLAWAKSVGYNDTLTIDRIDCDGDYEPNNCRFVDVSTNNANKRISSKNKTGFIGVHKDKHGKFEAYVNWKRKKHNLGRYSNAWSAARARDDFVIHQGLPHRLNF